MPHTTDTMTARERMLAAIHQREVDRFPVWLKMANNTWRTTQPDDVRAMDDVELLTAAGCDLLLGNAVWADPSTPHATLRTVEDGNITTRIWQTPDGPLTETIEFDPATRSRHPTKHPVETVEDLAAVRWLLRDRTWTVPAQRAAAARDRQQACEDLHALTMAGIGPGPLMNMVEELCGPVNCIYLMTDAPSLFAEVLDLLHADRMAQLRAILPASSCDTFWLTENTSTTLISPDIFRAHCMPHLTAYGDLVLEHDLIPVHHMCGTIDLLLEDIDSLPALVNEAFTTAPVGDTSLAAGRTRMPSKCLIGGTNATLWLSRPEDIVAAVAADLAACPNRRGIVLTSAGVLPPPVNLEKARTVVELFKQLPTA